MLSNLQQLPIRVWILTALVIVIASLVFLWVWRNYSPGKVKINLKVVEVEFERKKDEKPAVAPAVPPTAPQPVPAQRTQEMTRSKDGEQAMHGNKGGVQEQKMTDSPRGKQTMD